MNDQLIDAIARVLQFVPSMRDDEFDVLIGALQSVRQRQKDGVLLRQIVADNRRAAHLPPSPTVSVGDGPKGWVEARPLDDWQHQVGLRHADRLMDAQDRADRAKRGGR
jgi:hypothetical protein